MPLKSQLNLCIERRGFPSLIVKHFYVTFCLDSSFSVPFHWVRENAFLSLHWKKGNVTNVFFPPGHVSLVLVSHVSFLTAVSVEVGSGPCSPRAFLLTRVPPRGSLPQMCIPASLPKCQLQEPNVPTVSQSFDFMIYYPLTLPLDNNRRLFTGHPWDDSGLTHWAARHNLQPGPPVPTDIWRGVFTLSQHFSQWGVHTALVPARRAVCVHNQERESSLGGRHKLWPQQDLPEQCMHVLRWSHEA